MVYFYLGEMLDISIIKCLSDNYSYLIRDKKTNTVAVVDPSEMDPIDFEIQRLRWSREDEMLFLKNNLGYNNRNKITKSSIIQKK